MSEPHPPDRMLAEVASLLNLLGGIAPKHLVVVGAWVREGNESRLRAG